MLALERNRNLQHPAGIKCERKGEAFLSEGAQERFIGQDDADADSRQMGRTLAQGLRKERHWRWLAYQQILEKQSSCLMSPVPRASAFPLFLRRETSRSTPTGW